MRLVTRERAKRLARAYMRAWHGFEVLDGERLPPSGPALMLWNHSSFLDAPAIMALDPYPDMVPLTAGSVLRAPVVGRVYRAWEAIPVERDGRDTAGVGALIRALRSGRVVSAAVEGERTWTGRLGQVHPVLAALAADLGVPVVPLGIRGAAAAMPRGARFPRRRRIVVAVGEPFVLPRRGDPEAGAARIREAIARLLPAEGALSSR